MQLLYKIILYCVLSLCWQGGLPQLCFSSGAGSPQLFSAGTDKPAEIDPRFLRQRLVKVNVQALSAYSRAPVLKPGQSGTLNLNLFSDLNFTARFDRIELNPGGGFVWLGHIADHPYSLVVFVVRNNTVAGILQIPGYNPFQIRFYDDRYHLINELDPSAAPPWPAPIEVEKTDIEQQRIMTGPAQVADDGSTIDVMVIYTTQALADAGSSDAMLNEIDLAISLTNTSYANSQINQRVRLVHSAEINYTESGSIFTDLEYLALSNDGNMDEVHTLRDSYAADLVVLVTGLEYITMNEAAGVAYLMTTVSTWFSYYAFSVIEEAYLNDSTYVMAHEMGHNMGANHDRYVTSEDGAYPYSHGLASPEGQWRTVMAYYNHCADQGIFCGAIGHWSNPQVSYAGVATGVGEGEANSADNAKTLNNTAWTVANFRQSDTRDSGSSDNTDTSGREAVYRLWNTVSGEHHYTADTNEYTTLINMGIGWINEGVSFYVYAEDTDELDPVYRFHNPSTGYHFYTISGEEKTNYIAAGWNYEGISYYAYTTSTDRTLPLYRMYNSSSYEYLFSTDLNECNSLNGVAGWTYLGIAFYVE